MKVNSARAAELVADAAGLIELSLTRTEAQALIVVAVREQTEWLMELVCEQCGGHRHLISETACNAALMMERGGKPLVYQAITRAEYLHRKGENP